MRMKTANAGKLKNRLLNGAIAIGDRLIRDAVRNNDRITWEDLRGNTGIHMGAAGMLLFFAELARQTKQDRFMETALCIANDLTHPTDETAIRDNGFFVGRVGIAYALSKLYKITGDTGLLDHILRLALEAETTWKHAVNTATDLMHGSAGNLLGLLHIHETTKSEAVLALADGMLARLLTRARLDQEGLHWGRESNQIRGGLASFAHAGAGIGFAFLEASDYLNNPALMWPAEQAFLYENASFDKTMGTWPDMRSGFPPRDQAGFIPYGEAAMAGDFGFFKPAPTFSFWCHGAPGIGLSRLRAIAGDKKKIWRQDLKKALTETRRATITDPNPHPIFTLCHGAGGNAMLFLETYRQEGDQVSLKAAIEVAERMLDYGEAHGNQYMSGISLKGDGPRHASLFMGDAGIGYYYLQMADPNGAPSVTAPRLESRIDLPPQKYQYLGLSLEALKGLVLGGHFKRTLYLLNQSGLRLTDKSKNQNSTSEAKRFTTHMKDLLEGLPAEAEPRLREAYSLEYKRLLLDASITPVLQACKHEAYAEKRKAFAALNEQTRLQTRLRLAIEVTLIETQWQWDLDNNTWQRTASDADGPHGIMLLKKSDGLIEKALHPLVFATFSAFEDPTPVGEVMQRVIAGFDIDDEHTREQVKQLILTQIREAVKSGILLIGPEETFDAGYI